MGDIQSAQRESKKDAAAEQGTGPAGDAQTGTHAGEKPLKNNGQIAETNRKADASLVEINVVPPEDEIVEKPAEEQPPREAETPVVNVDIVEKEAPNEADANADEELCLEMTEVERKQNDINESFKNFFNNIGLRLTVKRGSTDVPIDEEPGKPAGGEDAADDTKRAEQNPTTAQESHDNESTTCPTLTDVTPDEPLENVEEKTEEAAEAAALDVADAGDTLPASEDALGLDPEENESPIKRFFNTGIFSGLRKKRKSTDDETTEKELVDMREKGMLEAPEQTEPDQQEETSSGVGAAAEKENESQEKTQTADGSEAGEEKSPATDTPTNVISELEIPGSQEKVQASPLKRLLTGSGLRRNSKKQKGRKSSDAKLSDSGEHFLDLPLASPEPAEHPKEEGPGQPSLEATGEEDGVWASFKKLMTPKKHTKRVSLTNEEAQTAGIGEEPKRSDGEHISDHSTEESKKRKDSSVSWEAVLCGSGRRRSRKTSDSEEETPQTENDNIKRADESKRSAESPIESSDEIASSPKHTGSSSEGDGGSTWKSFKKLVTPKRKAKDEEESKEHVHSDTEVTQDESTFSIKKILPSRKKRKSTGKQEQVSSDEADKEIASDDEDSETPAVVPLSEFDKAETDVIVESHVPPDSDRELQQGLPDQTAEPTLPSDHQQTEQQKVQDNESVSENQASTTAPTNEELNDLTELISKHQQLSDIPEESIITETMATPASVPEDAVIDDTLTEDMIEITSEAITAPEPVDVTPEDETEMVSAVSQLSESSKTSGNTTPVPAECDVEQTEALLHEVVEMISTTPCEVPVVSDELSSEQMISSVSHQILEGVVKEEPNILGIHGRSEQTAIKTGLNVEELDAVVNLTATAETESVSGVNEAVSTELAPENSTEELDVAETAVDEVHEVDISQPKENVKEIESTSESQRVVECLTEVNEAVSAERSSECEEMRTDDGVTVCTQETEPPNMDYVEAATNATETEDGVEEQEELLETTDEGMQISADRVQVEDRQPVVEEEFTAQGDSGQSTEKQVISEESPADEATAVATEEEAAPLTEVSVETEDIDDVHEEAPKAVTMESEETGVETLETEARSEEIPESETFSDEPKLVTEHLTAVTEVDSEDKGLPTDKPDHEVSEIFEAVEALDSEECHAEPADSASEDVTEEETVEGGFKDETVSFTEEGVKTDHMDGADVESDAVQAVKLDSKEGSAEPAEEEVISEAEIVTDEPTDRKESDATEAVRVDSEEGSVQPAEEDKISEDAPEEEIVTDEPREVVSVEPDHKDGILAESDAIEAVGVDSEEGSVQPAEEKISEDVPEEEIVADEPREEVSVEPDHKDGTLAESDATEAVGVDSEEGSVQPAEEDKISQDVLEEERVADEPREEMASPTEVGVDPANEAEQPVDALKTETEVLEATRVIQLESDEGHVQSLKQEEISKGVPAEEFDTDVLKEATDAIVESEEAAEGELLACDVKDLVAETGAEVEAALSAHELSETAEEDSAREPRISEEIPEPKAAADSEEVVSRVAEVNRDQEAQDTPDQIPEHVHIEQEDGITEVVDELPEVTAVHVSSVNEGARSSLTTEKVIISEDAQAPRADVAASTDEATHELRLSEVQVDLEGEKEGVLPERVVLSTVLEHSVIAQVTTCDIKEVVTEMPDVSTEETADVQEPLVEASEIEFKETVETTTPFVEDAVTGTAQADNGVVVTMMRVPALESEGNHRIQVQEVNVEVESAETVVNTVLEVGITKDKEVIDICQETVKEVDNLSAAEVVQEELIDGENKVTIREVAQHEKENLPEELPESVSLEEDVLKEQAAATAERESTDQTVTEESSGSSKERPDEKQAIASDNSAVTIEQGVPDVPGGSDVSTDDLKEGLEGAEAELEKSGVCVAAEEATCSSEEGLATRRVCEGTTQGQENASTQVVAPRNAPLATPENTGVISSVGNVEPPSSLSLEFKLNIQFGQTRAPACPPSATERPEPKQTDMSEVQTVDKVASTWQTTPIEIQPQKEQTDVVVQATEITEPHVDSAGAAKVTNPSVLLDIGIRAMETVQPVEEIESTERVIPNVQAKATMQPVRRAERRGVSVRQQVILEACDREKKTVQSSRGAEEEHEQDVWMDAEETIGASEDTEVLFAEGAGGREAGGEREREAAPEEEFEMAPTSDPEEGRRGAHKAGGTCDNESDAEDFAVALEHPESASVARTDWD